jgi:SAM-dependent methyltransferase
VPENIFRGRVAESYDRDSADMFEPALLGATADFLAEEAAGGHALEFGIGTGRVALPLSRRSVDVHGIDISADMIDQLRRKPGAEAITTTIGDIAETVVPGSFSLVFCVFNVISNLLTQAEQVRCFRNAARHLRPGGRFVVELWMPDLRHFPPGAVAIPFQVDADHLGFDTLDVATQRGASHHYYLDGDHVGMIDFPFRYAWPAELDLMAAIAGMELHARWADWDRSSFTSDSVKHISVWTRPNGTAAA